MNCRNCGNLVRESARFCAYCGSAQERRSGPCPHCGSAVNVGMRFCRQCGNSLEGIFCPLCQRPNRLNVRFCAHCGAQMTGLTAAEPFLTGKLPAGLVLNGRYVIIRKIAQGGMGAVYEAKEVPVTAFSRRLAIKEMSFSMLDHLQKPQQRAVVESFHREFDFLSKLNHPNLVRAFEFFEENGRQFFVMEYIEGKTLESLLELLPPGSVFPLDRVLDWARQLCNALQYLHSQNPPIIYRDLKPSNIMEVAGSHLIKLFDFGIARYYKPGQRSDTVRFGTDGYLAPEIVAYQTQTSKQTDVFALGAVLHQLLTRYDPQFDPWRRPSILSVNPLVPVRVMKAIEHALSLNPSTRSTGADLVLKELFGDQAEEEATFISMQNPFKGVPPPAEQQAAQVEMPAGWVNQLQVPLADVAQAQPGANLELGRVQKGQRAARQLEIQAPVGVKGRLTSNIRWLTATPEIVDTENSRITVIGNAKDLPVSSWASSTKPPWFANLPGLARTWLGVHANILVPLPRKYHGLICIQFPGYKVTPIEVSMEVEPSLQASIIGWLVVVGLMTIEALLLFLVLLSIFLISL